jgi:hypothetical protein
VFAIARGRRGGSRGEELEARREELLQALTQLEADLQRKKIAAPLYKKQKAALTGKLEAVYAEAHRVTPRDEVSRSGGDQSGGELGVEREPLTSETSEAP